MSVYVIFEKNTGAFKSDKNNFVSSLDSATFFKTRESATTILNRTKKRFTAPKFYMHRFWKIDDQDFYHIAANEINTAPLPSTPWTKPYIIQEMELEVREVQLVLI